MGKKLALVKLVSENKSGELLERVIVTNKTKTDTDYNPLWWWRRQKLPKGIGSRDECDKDEDSDEPD